MAINLKAPKKVDLNLQNPIQAFKNPVEDFLAPMKQTKTDLEQKIAQISAGNNNPNTIIPEMKYNPSTQFTDFGNQTTGAGLTTEQPSLQTTTPREFGVAPGFEGQTDITKSIPYKALSPMEGFLQGGQEITKDFSQNLQDVGQKISEVSTQMGDTIQNKAPLLEKAKVEGKYLTQNQVKDFLKQNKNMTDDQLVTAMSDLEKEGFFFEGYNDLTKEGQAEQGTYVGSLKEGAGSIIKGVGGIFGMGAEALGGTMEGVQNIAEGQTGLGVSQIAGQVPNIAMTAINTIAPGAGALASSAFSTDEGQAVLEPVMGVSEDISKKSLDLTGMDPNSEEYQNYLKGLSGTLPLVATAGVAGGVKKFSPEIKTGLNKTGEFIKEKAPIIGEAVKGVVEKIPTPSINIKNPLSGIKTSKENVTAKTEAGTEFTVEQTPTLGKNITDKAFHKENEILAQQSVFPKATKEKTPQARLDSAEIALNGVKQLYEDTAQGNVKSDIHSMGGGVDGIQEGLDFHGKKIGELTKSDTIVDTADLTPKLAEVIAKPFSSLNPEMHNLANKVVEEFTKVGNKADISTIQDALSSIKSEIFGNGANIAKLYKTPSGRALNDFLKNLEERFQKTIEETSGNSAELAKAKQAYSRYKKIEKDLTDSYMVELRNQGKGITGTAGKVAGLYEVLSNPSISGILKAVALKQAGETMQYYKSRGGNWETLIRNLDREAVQRQSNPNTPKNDSNSKPSSSNMDNSKPIEKGINIQKDGKLHSSQVDISKKEQVIDLKKQYKEKMTKGTSMVIDSDKIKEFFHDYNPKDPSIVHEPSSKLATEFYKIALEDPKYKKVVLTAGGGGSGKSEILVSGIKHDSGTLVFDGTGKNFKKITEQYDQSVKSGKDTEIKAVFIDFGKATKFNAKRERSVPNHILADTHKGYRETLLKIAKERPDIKISLKVNSGIRNKNGEAIVFTIPRKDIQAFLEKKQELE